MSTPFYDLASLVLVPSGYKTSKVYAQKPLTTDGQLAFTRSTTATRVGSDGLIEKVRTNLMPQSNTFSNATWNKVNSTVTSGQSGYDATSNAWLLTDDATSAAHSITQFTRWATTLQTGSVYVKAGTNTKAYIGNATTNRGAFFNLSTGTLEGTIGTVVSQSIVSVGSGWYRISVTLESAGTFIIGSYQTFVAGNFPSSIAYSGSGSNILIQNSQLEAGDIATDYIATTTAAVSVGPVANVPRLDYSGGSSCPRLLLEPQRTNLIVFSERFDNAAYTKLNSSITANAGVSPDGYTNADKLVENTANTFHLVGQTRTLEVGLVAYSFYAKAAGRSQLRIDAATAGLSPIAHTFNLDNGTSVGGFIEPAANGFFRCSGTFNVLVAGTRGIFVVLLNSAGVGNYLGDGVSGALLYGMQYEQAAYATSYIPTLGAAVTRGADVCSKSSISSILPTQTGTLYAEFDWQKTPDDVQVLSIHNNSTGLAWIQKSSSTTVQGTYFASGYIGSINGTVSASAGIVKVAYAWTNGRQALYINGVQVGTDTEAITDSNDFSIFEFNGFWGIQKNGTSVASALVFPTALSNSDLAALTA